MRKEAVIFLAEGFEEIEALTVVDVLRRAGACVRMVAAGIQKSVTDAHQSVWRQMKYLGRSIMKMPVR